ncbi:MAG TPA: hypothetical protein VKX49_16395 [Bryobacteraceae bacterium]|nr:hypothetical protein [Bryobacteraceae bacterium]
MTALSLGMEHRGHGRAAHAGKRAKARENGERYAHRTAQNAAAAVERNRQRSRA